MSAAGINANSASKSKRCSFGIVIFLTPESSDGVRGIRNREFPPKLVAGAEGSAILFSNVKSLRQLAHFAARNLFPVAGLECWFEFVWWAGAGAEH
jgi:hypothetical protein